jgi:hypothetical protein
MSKTTNKFSLEASASPDGPAGTRAVVTIAATMFWVGGCHLDPGAQLCTESPGESAGDQKPSKPARSAQ